MKLNYLAALLVFVAAVALADAKKMALNETLSADLNNGAIDRAQFVAYQLMGIKNSPKLPDRYKSLQREMSRMGTSYMMEASALVNETAGPDQLLLRSVLYRPDYLPLSMDSPSGLFKLHYSDVGQDAAADTFVAMAAKSFDYSYDVIVNQLHFDPPPHDDIDGPQYDVYVYDLGDYGLTTPDGAAPTDAHPNGAVSFIHMDNTFDRTYTRGVDGMLVTTAHEFLHMVQMGYRNFTTTDFDSRWLFEGCAVWMEDYAYDDINDYLQYLPYYLGHPDQSFFTFNGLHEYGSALFYMMLEQKYGPGIIRKIWEQFATKGVFEALDDALRQQGSSFALELSDHMVWNYFTGSRVLPEEYYEEGSDYPEVTPGAIDSLAAIRTISGNANLLSGAYIKVELQGFGEMSIQPEMDAPSNWMYAVIHQAEGQKPETFISTGGISTMLPDVTPASNVFVIPINVHVPEKRNSSVQDEYGFALKLGELGEVTAGIQSIAPNPFVPQLHAQGARINVRLTEKTDKLTLHIATEQGRVIYSQTTLFDSAKKGDFSLHWDGCTTDGELAASGVYIVFIEAQQQIAPGKIALVR